MHQFSDSDTPDSDEGIRFKTDSTRNKESNRKSFDTSRDGKRSKSRSGSLERRRNRRRDEDRNRDRSIRERSRERCRRRSYSRERRSKHKSRECSRERATKTDRLPAKFDRERSKRSASADLKSDTNKRRKESKTESKTKPTESKERDCKRSSTKPTNTIEKDLDLVKSSTDSNLVSKDIEICLEPSGDLEAFGPALPPKIANKQSATVSHNVKRDTSISPRCISKNLSDKESSVDEDQLNPEECRSRRDTRTFSKVSTSPISSEDPESVPEDDLKDDDETFEPKFNPPEHKVVIEIEDSDVEDGKLTEDITYGPILPSTADEKPNNSSISDCSGPDTHINNTEDLPSRCKGPFVPEDLRQKLWDDAEENGNNTNISLSNDEIEEGEIVGPILPGSKACLSAAQIALEERALQYKLDQLNCPSACDATVRDDWMVSLPEAGKISQIALGPRQFKAKAGPDLTDRSSWTDTPKDKEAKKEPSSKRPKDDNGPESIKAEADRLEINNRDTEQERLAKRHHRKHRKKGKKDKSLLEMHQDKLKTKQTNDDDGQNTRRPFNRDVDLKVNQFDESQKKAIYKKAQLLDDRFSKGESKYL